ncbi:MAG TPA: hypothetical protein VGF80_06910 [Galbitalea sp.]|jgi:hypothetical protein
MPIREIRGESSLPTPAPVAIIRPSGAEPWVLSAGFNGVGGLYGTPSPDHLCVVALPDRVVWVEARTGNHIDLGLTPVRVAGNVDHGLLLIGDWHGITAIGADGIRWESAIPEVEDLHITRSDGDRIYYRGMTWNGTEVLGSVDSATGDQ